MKILISNDDGIYADGINVLAAELSKIGEITVIAPDRNRSGASNSLSVENPIRVRKLSNGYYTVTGTPTDCVHLAVTGLFDTKFDMVVSGINAGANLGDDVIYSGTVAAATEGRMLGLPALAISLVGKDPQQNYATAAKITRQLIEHLTHDSLPRATVLNINVPDVSLDEITGLEVTRLGSRHQAQPAIKTTDPRGYPVYWIGPSGAEEDAGPGTDFHAINSGKVSITPIKADMTSYSSLEVIEKWMTNVELVKK